MIYLIKFFFCGLITALLFPPFFLFPLGFIIFPYLFFLLCDKKISRKKNFQLLCGTFYGLGLNCIVLIWIKEPFLIDSNTKSISLISYLLILYISFYCGFSFYILSFFKNNFLKLILIPVIFVISEILREKVSFGFPWVTFALINSSNHIILNLTYYIGTYGLSFLTIFMFLTPASLILFLNNIHLINYFKIYWSISIATIVICIIMLNLRFNQSQFLQTKQEFEVSLNQLNISQSEKWKKSLYKKRFNKIVELINADNSNLIIFSETDYPFVIRNHDIVEKIQSFLKNNQTVIIGGIKNEEDQYYNSLYLIEKNTFDVFDKKILVPFGEFLPFRQYLNLKFINSIVGNVDFSVGTGKRFMTLLNNINIIPVICYEIIFFNDLLDNTNRFSPLLINLTNDAWFGKFSGPYQHFYLSRMRSAEFNKYLIRVSNNGVSAIIDNYGNIFEFIPLNIKNKKNVKIAIPKELKNHTQYHNLIYPFLILLIIISLFVNTKNE